MTASFDLKLSHTRSITCVFDADSGPKVIGDDLSDPSWVRHIRQRDLPDPYSANNSRINTTGTIMLLLRIGEVQKRVVFKIVEQPSLPTLLGTSFIDRYMKPVFPEEREIVPQHSFAVLISMVQENIRYNSKTSTQVEEISLLQTAPEDSFVSITVAADVRLRA